MATLAELQVIWALSIPGSSGDAISFSKEGSTTTTEI
jgi:hypothetical protein